MSFTCGSIEMEASSSQERDGALSPVPSLTGSTTSFSSLSSYSSQPTTPKSTSSHTLHRFASRDSLYSPADDKYTQIPMVSPRERRSSSVAVSQSARRRKSLANLSTGGAITPTATPSRHLAPPLVPLEGKRLSRKHVEASRRSAKEALEEDLRALDLVGNSADRSMGEDYALDCYLTSLDYLVKAWRADGSDVKTRKAIRARLQVLSDSLITPEERAEQANRNLLLQSVESGNAASAGRPADSCHSKASSLLDHPSTRLFVAWASLLVLQILAVFERNQFGTMNCESLLQYARLQYNGPSSEKPMSAQSSVSSRIVPDGSTVSAPSAPSIQPDAVPDIEPSQADQTILPSPRQSPSHRMRTEARKRHRASLAPSIELDGEERCNQGGFPH